MRSLQNALKRLQRSPVAPQTRQKWQALIAQLKTYPAAALAFSGGVDSSFLLCAAALACPQVAALTVESEVDPQGQRQLAIENAQQAGMTPVFLPFYPLQLEAFHSNPPDRCYHCKREIFRILQAYAHQHGFPVMLEGQNADDLHEVRPGIKAVREAGILSPLAQNGLTKPEIRTLAKALGFSFWNQPSAPCLATRIPHGAPVTREALQRVSAAENYLHSMGFKIARVRIHQDMARIEIESRQFQRLLKQHALIVDYFKEIGFRTVSLDLQGYRSGSLNEG